MCLWSGVTYPFNYISVNQAITISLSFFLHFYTYLSTYQPIYHMTKQWLYIKISKIQSTVIPYFSVLLSHNLHGTMSIYLSRNTAHYFLIYPFYNPLSQISSWKYFFLANTVGLLWKKVARNQDSYRNIMLGMKMAHQEKDKSSRNLPFQV